MKSDEAKDISNQALAELAQALEAGYSDTLQRFLDFMGRFYKYSWNNCLRIAFQMPNASQVAGFRRWQELGRHVRKGEKGIGILAPMAYRQRKETTDLEEDSLVLTHGYKVVHVFDVSQTEGQDLPQLSTIQGEPGEFLPRLEGLIRDNGITLTDELLPVGTKGVSRKGHIAITEGLPQAERFAVLVHELSHEWMHDIEQRRQMTRTVRETEAEAVAYVVCRAFGFDCSTRSSDYIQLYRGDAMTLAESLQRIQKTATRIIESLHETQQTAEEGNC